MSGPKLFERITVGGLTLRNRIVIAPMCQYSAENGCMTDWHQIHLGHLALSSAGLLTIEATAVVPEGRITYGDVGLWDDATTARVLQSVRRWSDMPIALQLAHAGVRHRLICLGREERSCRPPMPTAGRPKLPRRCHSAPEKCRRPC